MDVHAGIFWDPREPLPPGVEAVGALDFGAPILQAYREDQFYLRPPHRPQPQPQPGPHGGWDEVAIPKPQRNNLSPLSVSLSAWVVQDTAKVTVTQLFWNNTNKPIWKGAYTFPLSAGCTVTGFSCRIGKNKIVNAKVKSKPDARDTFHEALRTNQSAGLLEQNTPEIFTATLGNIPANTKLRTEITYITLLKHKFADNCSTTTLTIPTNIAPRYGSPPSELQNTPIPGLSHGISIQVDVVAEEAAHKIWSNSHSITIERGIGRNLYDNWTEFATIDGANDVEILLVKLEDSRTFLDKDFVVNITREVQSGLETPTAWLETHPTLANHRAVMLTIPPKFMLRNQSSNPDGEIIFLADRSGSMSDKIESLKSAMNFFLKGIPQGRKFNIWCFGSHYTSLWPQSIDYSEDALQEAMNYVSEQFSADMGGTEILGALKAIAERRNQDLRMADIVMLTDGEVWGLDETISFVQDTSRSSEGRIRYFALGIGNAVSHELVEGIAKAGGGYAEVIPAASQGGWEDRIVAMLSAALTGHVGPFQIEFDGGGEDHARGIHLQGGRNRSQPASGPTRPDILQSPADISKLSPFLRNRAFMLFDSAKEKPALNHINIKATAPGGEEITTRIPIYLVERKDSTLHKLGARALIGDLERGQSWIHIDPNAPPQGSTQEQKLVRQEGEALGCKWSLVSKWTSFCAVENPYHAAENARVPFLDAEDIQIREAVGELGLLRRRGVAAQQANLPAVPLPAALAAVEEDNGSDDDEDTASNSDHVDIGSDGDGDSDSDDEGNNGDGGGAGGNQTGGGAGNEQMPELGYSNADGDGGATGGNSDTQNDATVPNASPEAADHTITYDSLLAPPFPRAPGTIQTPSSLLGQLSNRGEIPAIYDNTDILLGSDPPSSSTQPFPQSHSLGYLSNSFLEDSTDSAYADSQRRYFSSYDFQASFPSEELAEHQYMNGAFQHPLPGAPDGDYRGLGSINHWSSAALSSFPTINAPSFNIPASTAMHSNESRTSKSAQEIAGEQKIRNVLVFQTFDGSFDFGSVEQLRTHLGLGFASVVQDLQLVADFKLAVTVGFALLLEEKFEYCRDLWRLVYNKAIDYLKTQQPLEPQRNLLLRSARLKVRALSISQILQPAAPAQPVALPPAHEQILAESSRTTKRSDDMETGLGIGSLNKRSWEEDGAAVSNKGSSKRVVLDTAPIED